MRTITTPISFTEIEIEPGFRFRGAPSPPRQQSVTSRRALSINSPFSRHSVSAP